MNHQPIEWTSAFPGQRPPFAPGNELPLKHGARSPRRVDPIADALVEQVRTTPGLEYLGESRFEFEVRAWAAAEARVALLEAWIDGMGPDKAGTAPKGGTPPLGLLLKYETAAANARSRLGLNPTSWVSIRRNLAGIVNADAQTQHLGALAEAGRHAAAGRQDSATTQAQITDAEVVE